MTTTTHAPARPRRWSICRRETICNPAGEPYLIRYRIVQTPWLGLYLHHILRSDDDRALHDHPWPFLSFILRGGYWEHTPIGRAWYPPLSILWRCPEQLHRLELPETKTAWTLVVRGRRRRAWGFHDNGQWRPAGEYLGEQRAPQ
jgi:hypothetical protein